MRAYEDVSSGMFGSRESGRVEVKDCYFGVEIYLRINVN